MQQVVEGMVSLFFVVLLVFTGIEIAGAMTTASGAQAFKVDVMERIEECNYDSDVINACFREARDRGFSLVLRVYYSNGRVQTYQSAVVKTPEGCYITGGTVVVRYTFEIPFLGVVKRLDTAGIIL